MALVEKGIDSYKFPNIWYGRFGQMLSMDGRGRTKDNIWIERSWKTIKYEYICLTSAETVIELREGIAKYMNHYNFHRRHHGIRRVIPYNLYTQSVA